MRSAVVTTYCKFYRCSENMPGSTVHAL